MWFKGLFWQIPWLGDLACSDFPWQPYPVIKLTFGAILKLMWEIRKEVFCWCLKKSNYNNFNLILYNISCITIFCIPKGHFPYHFLAVQIYLFQKKTKYSRKFNFSYICNSYKYVDSKISTLKNNKNWNIYLFIPGRLSFQIMEN